MSIFKWAADFMVNEFSKAVEKNPGELLAHCRSAGRVSYLWAAYHVKYQGFAANSAINIAKKIKYSFTLEELLGVPLSIEEQKK